MDLSTKIKNTNMILESVSNDHRVEFKYTLNEQDMIVNQVIAALHDASDNAYRGTISTNDGEVLQVNVEMRSGFDYMPLLADIKLAFAAIYANPTNTVSEEPPVEEPPAE